MTPPVYSTQFLNELVSGIDTETYVVPAGHVAVLKDVSAFLQPTSDHPCEMQVSTGGAIFIDWSCPVFSQSSAHWYGGVVIPAGQDITVSNLFFGSHLSYVCSGFLFLNP